LFPGGLKEYFINKKPGLFRVFLFIAFKLIYFATGVAAGAGVVVVAALLVVADFLQHDFASPSAPSFLQHAFSLSHDFFSFFFFFSPPLTRTTEDLVTAATDVAEVAAKIPEKASNKNNFFMVLCGL
jgi:hypothetical protein